MAPPSSSPLLLSLLGLSMFSSLASALMPMLAPRQPASTGQTCTVTPLGGAQDDAPQILAAFAACNHGGTVVFPENATYHIATRLNPVLADVTIEWRGTWRFSDDLDYWRANAYPVAFQNHAAGFVLSGERIRLDGHGTGGIDGGGDAWYAAEEGDTQPGRPMPFVWWNVSDVLVEHCMSLLLAPPPPIELKAERRVVVWVFSFFFFPLKSSPPFLLTCNLPGAL